MKYAKEVIELMSAYPGRDFRMIEIVRYVGAPKHERHKVRVGVSRVLQALQESGLILVRPPSHARGGYALYRWIDLK